MTATPSLTRTTTVAAPAADVATWLSRPESLFRLTPPWVPIRELRAETRGDDMHVLVGLDHRRLGPATTFRFASENDGRVVTLSIEAGTRYRYWELTTRVHDGDDDGSCRVEQTLDVTPLGGSERRDFEQWLAARAVRMDRDVRTLRAAPPPARQPLTVAIAGASGMLGTELTQFLRSAGQRVCPMVRRKTHASDDIEWDPAAGMLDRDALAGIHAVVVFSGVNIAASRWTDSFKEEMRESRIDSVSLIARRIAELPEADRPRVLVSMSGMSYYGDTGDDEVTEDSPPGDDFLAKLSVDWEAATEPAREAGVRTVIVRSPPIISSSGGPLPKLMFPFRLGLGGRVGNGRQHWPWIDCDDMIAFLWRALVDGELRGPFNVSTPQAPTNREFTKALGRAVHRPTIFPLPAFMVKLLFGEMGRVALLSGQNARPQKLQDAGFDWFATDLEEAIRFHIGRMKTGDSKSD